MKTYFFAVALLVLALTSCEDSKKTSEEKTKNTSEIEKSSEKNISNPEAKKNKKKEGYPLITQDNVTEFLTEYGQENTETKVKLETRLGDIYIDLYQDTPLHRANFVYLIKQGYFNETQFHRVIPNFIIQGGNSDSFSVPKKRSKIGEYRIPAELENGRVHTYGTVSGAKEYRENPDKLSAPFEFFIFLGPQSSTSHLNGNYTIFGKVTQGMDVVEKISKLERNPQDDWPMTNVYIKASLLD